ncbi:MAG: tRNA glutamyl-Q(34) synthetase GluQRS [Gammaproteobacteria bacterium]|nr:tRNA glutamyl-Q(34) synthetase GluQRS [Gammaproteobacteria bacterium]
MTGRFAPSPTGPLHLGSMLAATASYLDAHAHHQTWLLRIDDLDLPRSQPGADDAIKIALDAHHLHWDGAVIYQSERIEHYQRALQTLAQLGLVFYCRCSRRQLKQDSVYPGTCRTQTRSIADAAKRIKVNQALIEFEDLVQGPQHNVLANSIGDFVVRRRDGLIAYQLATAVDDGDTTIDSVVRGSDLLDNTPRQIYLMQLLGLTPPSYAHIPTLTHPDGSKLSKQTSATPINVREASDNLVRIFGWLGLCPPPQAERWTCAELVKWGIEHWRLANVPRQATITV